MTLSMVFNEQSLRQQAPDNETARKWMADFVRLLVLAVDQRIDMLRIHRGFDELELAAGYPMQRWFNDPEVNRTEQEFVLTYATKHPLIKPFTADFEPDDPLIKRSEGFIGTYEDEEALGLGYAFLLDGLAISLNSEPCWDAERITFDRMEDDLTTGIPIEDQVVVRHAAQQAHIAVHQVWIAERDQLSIRDGKELLKKAAVRYPHLVFTDAAKKQLQALKRSTLQLPKIINRLSDLERSSLLWTGKGYDIDHWLQGASYESLETLQVAGRERDFVCPDGKTRTFTMHLKNLPEHWRIHFWPDEDNELGYQDGRKIVVGYIGPHLTTASGY